MPGAAHGDSGLIILGWGLSLAHCLLCRQTWAALAHKTFRKDPLVPLAAPHQGHILESAPIARKGRPKEKNRTALLLKTWMWDRLSCTPHTSQRHTPPELEALPGLLYQQPVKEEYSCPGWCGSVDWVQACKPKGHRYDSQSGHARGSWLMYLSHIDVLSFSFPLSSPFSINK